MDRSKLKLLLLTSIILSLALTTAISSDECDCLPGDANGDGVVDVADAVRGICWLFYPGFFCPPPYPYPTCSGDANGDCGFNVGDAVYIIGYVFKDGDPPPTCDQWRDGGGAFGGCGEIF